MATHLLLDDKGVVINVIEYDGVSPADHIVDMSRLVKGEGNIGWVWDGEKAVDPNPTPSSAPPSTPRIIR